MTTETTLSEEARHLQRVVAGRYSIVREIGRGGMAVVFLARDVSLDRLVAVKLLPARLGDDEEFRRRFLREARMAAGLSHPNIVPIHSVEEHDDLVFFVMSFVDGESLGERVRRNGPMPPTDVMRIVREVSWALAHAHSRGIVHRDIKPDNILIERESGRAVVADFGIAAAADVSDGHATAGTVQFMSPEQTRGERLSGRSDVYSLGATAFFALTGKAPFEAETQAGSIVKRESGLVPTVVSLLPGSSGRLSSIIERCMAFDPPDRFESGMELSRVVGDAMDTVKSVPAPLQSFLRESEQIGAELGLYAMIAASVVLALELPSGGTDFLGIVALTETIAVTMMGGLAAVRFGQFKMRIRELLKSGYDHDSLAPAVLLDEARKRDMVPAASSSLSERLLLGMGVGVVGTAWWMLLGDVLPSAELLVFAIATFGPAALFLEVRRRLARRGSLWNRMMGGRVGRWMFKMMGIGLRGGKRAGPLQTQHTEILIEAAIEELFLALPEDARAALGDVPSIARKLGTAAAALRADNDPKTKTQMREAVAALENLRLDLMRAGIESGGELTEGISAARHVADQVDALAAIERDLADT